MEGAGGTSRSAIRLTLRHNLNGLFDHLCDAGPCLIGVVPRRKTTPASPLSIFTCRTSPTLQF
jgi:hypothetical protein